MPTDQTSLASAPSASPTRNDSVPAVGVTALAVIRSSRTTTCGSAADSPASRNRLTERQTRTSTNRPGPRTSAATAIASTPTRPTLAKLDQASTWRRDQRSRNTPTNGPSTLNGSSTTANAPAIAPGEGCRSGEKMTYAASATWKTPSVSWLATRTANSLRKARPRKRCVRWRTACILSMFPPMGPSSRAGSGASDSRASGGRPRGTRSSSHSRLASREPRLRAG